MSKLKQCWRSAALLAFLSVVASGQAAITPTSAASVQRGTNFTLTINSSGATATGPVAVQWTLTLPAGWSASSSATALAGKTIACTPTTNLKCLIYGATTATVIPNGPIATLSIAVPATATLGSATITTTGTLGATNAGASFATSGGSLTISVLPDPRDLTGDGIVDQSDVTAAVAQIFGTCTTADVAPPAGCDVIDLAIITLKAQGLIP